MILFYSPACRHCAMLLDSVQRFDSQGRIKRVDVNALRRSHPNLFAQIQMVPAFMLPTKQLLFGKAVFDYLLMPSRGILVSSAGGAATNANKINDAGATSGSGANSAGFAPSQVIHQEEGIMAFNSAKGSFGDAFASIEENHSTPQNPNTNPHSHYNWTSIEDMVRLGNPDAPSSAFSAAAAGAGGAAPSAVAIEAKLAGMNIETRAPKESLDLDNLRLQRERDIQSLYANQPMPIV
jgi:hypothetical protein